MRNKLCDKYLFEHYDLDSIRDIQEQEVFELVDFLRHDVERLGHLVMEAREHANILAARQQGLDLPYLMTAENVWDASFDDHPATLRYLELYKGDCCMNTIHSVFGAIDISTRPKRRRAIELIITELSRIRSAEMAYIERISENLQSSAACADADDSVDTLTDVIDTLMEAY